MVIRYIGASMGPQLDSCGRSRLPGAGGRSAMLQWGRNLIVAEGSSVSMPGRT